MEKQDTNSPEKKLDQLKKPNFLSGFWDSCFNLGFYETAVKASWLHIIAHTLILILIITISYSVATFVPLQTNLQNMFNGLPTVQIKDGEAVFDEKLKLPFVDKFPKTGNKKLYYIIDSGDNLAKIEESYPMYAIFTKTKMVFFDGKKRLERTYSDLEKDGSMKAFFGKPLTFSAKTLASFTSSVAIGLLGIIFFGIVLFSLPLFNLLAAFISSIADKWPLNLTEIFKLACFAATPMCLIQAFGCFFLNGSNYLLFLLSISWIVQIAYLVKGLKIIKAAK